MNAIKLHSGTFWAPYSPLRAIWVLKFQGCLSEVKCSNGHLSPSVNTYYPPKSSGWLPRVSTSDFRIIGLHFSLIHSCLWMGRLMQRRCFPVARGKNQRNQGLLSHVRCWGGRPLMVLTNKQVTCNMRSNLSVARVPFQRHMKWLNYTYLYFYIQTAYPPAYYASKSSLTATCLT